MKLHGNSGSCLFFLILNCFGLSSILCVAPSEVSGQTPTEIEAFFHSGQTFLTWRECNDAGNEFYRIYRHAEAITETNLNSAEMIATIPDSSAMFLTERWLTDWGLTPTQRNFIITDLGPELDDDQGLFVFTPHEGEEGTRFYAVTSVVGGTENTTVVAGDNALLDGVTESVDEPDPVLVWQSANRLARVYTQFMDFRNWNPTYTGYAYNYFLSLPQGYEPGTAYPLILHIEGHGTRYVAAYQENSASSLWIWDVQQKWGLPVDNLQIVNDPTYSGHLTGFDGMGVWDWQNHQQNMVDRQGDEMAFIHTCHGTEDIIIDWDTQGESRGTPS